MVLRTLGTLALDGTDFRRHKPLLLLAYLALEGPQERSYLARLFWPEAHQPSQRLRSTLELLRSGAPGAAERIGSKILSSVRCDAIDLQVALEDGDPKRCVALYEGAFLEGLNTERLGLELEEWVFATREGLAEYARRALLRLVETSHTDSRRAAHYARQAYLLSGAALPSSAQLEQISKALRAADDPLAASVKRDIDDTQHFFRETLDQNAAASDTLENATQRHNLATPPTALLGRGSLLLELKRRVTSSDVRLLTLTGLGGVGKTRLAVELAWRLLPYYDAVFFVPLARSHSPSEVLEAVAQALDLEAPAGRPLRDAIVGNLQGQDCLLILDNFEHVLEAATEVSDILARCRRLTVVVTSRSALRLRGEQESTVPPLPTPPAEGSEGFLSGARAHTYPSVALFCARAAEASGSEAFSEDELATIGDVCRRVDGLPLAIELAASRIKLFSPREILVQLDRSLDLLTQGARDLPERHRSLRGTLKWSYDLLTNDEKRLFRLLGIAPDGCDPALAAALWGDVPIETEAARQGETKVLDLLSSLLDKSLIVRATDAGGALRITMLETVRRFAAETLAADPSEMRLSLKRLYGYVQSLVVALRTSVARAETTGMAKVSNELGNIRAAWLWALAEGHATNVLQAVMFDFFAGAGRHQEGIRLFTSVLRRLETAGDAEARGRVYGSLAWFYYMTGNTPGARDAAEQSVIALRQVGQLELLGVALETYAGILYGTGDYPAAWDAYQEAYGLYMASNRSDAHVMVLHALGLVASAKGEYSKALELFGQAEQASRSQGLMWSRAETLARMGEVYRLKGNLEASRQVLEEGYALSQIVSATYSQTLAAYELSMTALASGNVEEAEALLEETLQAARSGARSEYVARAHLGMARTADARQEKHLVSEHLLEALLAVKNTGLEPVILSCFLAIAETEHIADVYRLLYVVRDHPAARACERHRAASLLSRANVEPATFSQVQDSLLLLSEQLVVRLLELRPDDTALKDDRLLGKPTFEDNDP